MYGGRDEGVDITYYFTGGYFLLLLNERPARGSYMLTKKNGQLFGRRDGLNRNFFGEVFVLRRMNTAGKS